MLLSFFLNFARFEYALKVSGFVKGGVALGVGLKSASPDWERYTESTKNSFDKTENSELREAVDYIWKNPPWNEVVTQEKKLLFETPVCDFKTFDLTVLLRFVRNVRNNLFHGSKHGDVMNGRITERSKKLLETSLRILDACLMLSPDVKSKYDNGNI